MSNEAQAAKSAYTMYEKWEQRVGREAASTIATDNYKRIYAELVEKITEKNHNE